MIHAGGLGRGKKSLTSRPLHYCPSFSRTTGWIEDLTPCPCLRLVSALGVMQEMFTQLGDTLALQYGGSETNKRVATEADQVCISNIPNSRRNLSVRLVCVYLGAVRGKRVTALVPSAFQSCYCACSASYLLLWLVFPSHSPLCRLAVRR
jgi:hypothetical protein